MNDINDLTVCPLPWNHFSVGLDTTMRICCNTDHSGYVPDNSGNFIKLDEVKDVAAYFNLNYYKNIRRKMLSGGMPKECSNCYNVEKYGGVSTRIHYLKKYKKDEGWCNSVKNTQKDGTIQPLIQSLDLSLSNKCNLKCIMCSPHASYKIKDDYDKLALAYNPDFAEGSHKNWNNENISSNILPQIQSSLDSFLTTGGEPFLNQQHQKMLELLVESGDSKNISLSYHTNCTIRNDKLFKLWHSFKEVSVHLSIDAYGDLNEYIRFGTKWKDVIENCKVIIDHPKTVCEIHTCVQVLNLFSLPELYSWTNELGGSKSRLPLHIWMTQPDWLKIEILPLQLKKVALMKVLDFFSKSQYSTDEDIQKKLQIISYLKRSISEPQNKSGLKNFKINIRNFEKLRNQRPIEEVVPEFKYIFNSKTNLDY